MTHLCQNHSVRAVVNFFGFGCLSSWRNRWLCLRHSSQVYTDAAHCSWHKMWRNEVTHDPLGPRWSSPAQSSDPPESRADGHSCHYYCSVSAETDVDQLQRREMNNTNMSSACDLVNITIAHRDLYVMVNNNQTFQINTKLLKLQSPSTWSIRHKLLSNDGGGINLLVLQL